MASHFLMSLKRAITTDDRLSLNQGCPIGLDRNSPVYSTRVGCSELRKTIRLLAETSSSGKARPEVGLKVLSFPYVSHVIHYLVHEQLLVVFAVLHKRMVPLNHTVGREMM